MSRLPISELNHAAKGLRPSEIRHSFTSKSSAADDQEALEALETIYTKHRGDLDAIFAELNSDPSKAKKPHHRPANAKDFAKNYLQGFYTVAVEEAESKK